MADANLIRKRLDRFFPRPAVRVPPVRPDVHHPAPIAVTEALMDEIADKATVRLEERDRTLAATSREASWREDLPIGVLGYLVAMKQGSRFGGTTHTTFMPLDEARREARKHRPVLGVSWVPVEIREVSQ
jgi:hypothetical protein